MSQYGGHMKVRLSSSVAIDDADNDDDCHTRKGTDAQHQPAVRELPRDNVAQEYGSWVNLVVRGVTLGGRDFATARRRGCSASGGSTCTVDGQVRGSSNGLDAAVVKFGLSRQIYSVHRHSRTSVQAGPDLPLG